MTTKNYAEAGAELTLNTVHDGYTYTVTGVLSAPIATAPASESELLAMLSVVLDRKVTRTPVADA
ncbi:hypothetical protein ACFWCH_05350 [Microbacterium sp. NPDC060132]|uniref:hypothetical protein n=1 Tax=unclassified Microbacterium TaxID=2609290 RepID=UPI0036559B33